MQRRFHAEQAFEHYLRSNRIPYVAVDEARRALLAGPSVPAGLKSFDFVVYQSTGNLLIDVKGRQYGRAPPIGRSDPRFESTPTDAARPSVASRLASRLPRQGPGPRSGPGPGHTRGRFDSWVTEDDVASLWRWQGLFGPGFQAVFVFAYCLRRQPPDVLFEQVFAFGSRWYALRAVSVDDYRRHMVPRSRRWRTVHLRAAAFDRLSQPFDARPSPNHSPAANRAPDQAHDREANRATHRASGPASNRTPGRGDTSAGETDR